VNFSATSIIRALSNGVESRRASDPRGWGRMMTREQYLHYENLLQLFGPPRDLKHKIRSRKLEAEPRAYDQSLRLLYYQHEPKTKPECY
jgi:hypothetical protein